VDNSQFHGQDGDIRAFGEFINAWLGAYDRWPSPKFLIEKATARFRSAGLSQELQSRHGIELNGIVLVSGAADVSDAVAGAEQRRGLGRAGPDVRGDGVVPQETAARSPGQDK